MSVTAVAWAKRQITGSVGRKAVLLVLADYADEHGSCFPGQATIARESEVSVRTVRRHLIELEHASLITREARGRKGGGRTSDRYILAIGAKATKTDCPVSSTRPLVSSLPESNPAIDDTQSGQDLAYEPSDEPPSAELLSSPPTLSVIEPGDDNDWVWNLATERARTALQRQIAANRRPGSEKAWLAKVTRNEFNDLLIGLTAFREQRPHWSRDQMQAALEGHMGLVVDACPTCEGHGVVFDAAGARLCSACAIPEGVTA